MTPLPNPSTDAQKKYNRHHKSTRRLVECAYGIWKERFPCLNHMRLDPEFAAKVVMATATFHNFASLEDAMWEEANGGDDEQGGAGNEGNESDELDAFVNDPSARGRQNTLINYYL